DFPEPRDGWWQADKSATPLPGADKGRHDKSAPTLSLRSFAYNEFIHPGRRDWLTRENRHAILVVYAAQSSTRIPAQKIRKGCV
ncbi:MAG: hypothetical protein ACJ8CB_08375, partial [Ktedonobacteraceae bacterium]